VILAGPERPQEARHGLAEPRLRAPRQRLDRGARSRTGSRLEDLLGGDDELLVAQLELQDLDRLL
jgi:hypothetical protein